MKLKEGMGVAGVGVGKSKVIAESGDVEKEEGEHEKVWVLGEGGGEGAVDDVGAISGHHCHWRKKRASCYYMTCI